MRIVTILLIAFSAGASLRAVQARIGSRGDVGSTRGGRQAVESTSSEARDPLATTGGVDSAQGASGAASRDLEQRLPEIARIIARLPTPSPTSEAVVLDGIVIDDDRVPLPGIVVRAVPEEDPSGSPGDVDARLEDELARTIRDRALAHRHRHDRSREVVSGADGRFRIVGLEAVDHRIIVLPEGASIRVTVRGDSRRSVVPGEEVEVQVGLPCDTPVEVRLPDGSLAEKATVHVDDAEHEWSAAESVLRLAPGWREIHAMVGERKSRSEVRWVGTGRIAPVILSLGPPDERGGIELTVGFADEGAPVAISACWLALAPGESPSEERLLRNSSNRRLTSSIDGRSIEAEIRLPPARYAIGIRRETLDIDPKSPIEARTVAVVGEGWTEVELTLPPPARTSPLEVRVLGPDGAPFEVERVYLETRAADGPGDAWGASWQEARRLATGSWQLGADREDLRVKGRSSRICADSRELGSRSVPVEGAFVEIRFEPRASLTVELAGWPDDGDAEVILFSSGSDGVSSNETEGNTTLFSPVQPGEARLEVRVAEQVVAALDGLRILPGENRVRLPVPPLSSLEVEIPPDRLSWHFALVRIDPGTEISRQPLRPDRRGATLRFEGLVHGAYSLVGSEMGGVEAMRIDVAGNAHVSFDGHQRTALLVRCRGEAPAGDGGLRDGDLIIGMEGEEFASPAEKDLLMMHLPEGGSPVRLVVDRPGVGKVDVEVPADSLRLHFLGWRSGGARLIEVPWE